MLMAYVVVKIRWERGVKVTEPRLVNKRILHFMTKWLIPYLIF